MQHDLYDIFSKFLRLSEKPEHSYYKQVRNSNIDKKNQKSTLVGTSIL